MRKALFLFTFCILSTSLYSQCWQMVSAGSSHTLAIKSDGTLWAWGFNGSGELGDGTTTEKTTPVQIGTATNWKTVSAGGNHSLAIKTDGTLWAWGSNFWGQLGDGSFGNQRNVPTKIGTATNWESISAGLEFSLAIKTDGTLWAWGDNFYGQLGFSNPAFSPTQVGTATDWKSISAGGNHTLAIKTDGTIWASGYNAEGQLGDGTTTNKNVFTKIGTSTNWKSIEAGYDFSLALKTDGTLWSWGGNDMGQLGDGSFTGKSVPAQIGTTSNWQSISAGDDNSLAVKTNGTLWAWGAIIGAFNFETENTHTTPTQLGTDLNWQTIASGDHHSFAFKTDGTLWGWGDNTWGRLGNGTWVDETSPLLLFTAAPSGQTMQTFCSFGTIADLEASGTNISWYATVSGGSPLAANTPLVNGSHYYATQRLSSCESVSRLDVTVSINTTPTPAPSGSSAQIFCSGATVTNLTATGNDIQWYTTATGGVALAGNTLLANGVHYFASQTVDACESVTRLEVTATENNITTPVGSTVQVFCAGATVTNLSATGINIKWYTTEFGGSALVNGTPLVNGTTYYASQTSGSLESCYRLAVDVTVHSTPPPTGPASQAFCSSAVLENLSVTGQGINWYETPSGGEALLFGSELQDEVHYYASQIMNDCESALRLDVIVHINTTPTLPPTGSATQTVCPGSTIGSLSATGTNIQWYSAAVDGFLWPSDMPLANGDHYFASQTIDACESASRLEVSVAINTTPLPTLSGTTTWQARSISAGYDFSVAIMDDGTLWTWGNNEYGQLGNGTKTSSSTPIQISTEANWKYVSAGASYSAAIKNDGSLWHWGNNAGIIPTQVGTETNWKYISAGDGHCLGLKMDGSLWAWGANYRGQLGDGTFVNNTIPTRIGTSNDWKLISAGGVQSAAIKNDGTLWTWGKIGIGSHDGVGIPVEMDYYANWQSISVGSQHILGIRSDGTLWAWGSNEYRQLGNGTPFNSDNDPKRIGNDTNWKSISAGMFHSTGIKQDGTLWSWGQNAYGQLGNGAVNEANVPTPITTDAGFQHVSAGGYFTLSIKTDGSVWVWGRNYFGELGDGTKTTRMTPTPLPASQQNYCPGTSLSTLSVTGNDIKWYDAPSGGSPLPPSMVLQTGNFYYASQTIDTHESCSRLNIRITTNLATAPTGSSTQVRCVGSVVSSLEATGATIKWYDQAVGGSLVGPSTVLINNKHYFASQTIGNCESTDRFEVVVSLNASVPSAPTGEANQSFCTDATIANLTATGDGIKWFENSIGGTALESDAVLVDDMHYYATQTVNSCESTSRLDITVNISSTEKPLPVTVVSNGWESISLFSFSGLGIRKDGTAWGWGDNQFGQLGNGVAYNSTKVPLQSGTDSWAVVASGDWHSAGIKANGTLWTWGDNHAMQFGLLGDGKGISKSEPIQIGTDTNWKSVTASFNFTIAIKKDGTLWAWGNNQYGQLGDGTGINKTVAVQVGNGSDWVSVTAGWMHVHAIKSDGSLWGWGLNSHGQLGDGTTTQRNNPTRIGSASDWKFIASSVMWTFGIKNDGSLWGWGDNHAGQLGDGTFTRSLVPKRIGTGTNWQSIATSIQDVHTLAVKTDGTLWSWGTGYYGELGNGVNTPNPVIVPVQVGTGQDWAAVDVGRFYSSAIKKDGTLWAWGDNNGGQLGVGTSQNTYNTPQLVASPSTLATQQLCPGSTIADLLATGTTVQWYALSTGGTSLPSSTTLVNGSHYYATQTTGGCESSSRLDVLVTINEVTPPGGSAVQSFCFGATVENLAATGNGIKWYATPTGGTELLPTSVLSNNIQYFASQTSAGCESPSRLGVTAVVQTTPAPTGVSPQAFENGQTIADLEITGSDVKWYSSAEDATTRTNPLPSTQVLVNNATYYATQTVMGCESTESLPITVSIITGVELSDYISQFYPNPVHDFINISTQHLMKEVTVTNSVGNIMVQVTPNSNHHLLDVTSLNPGIYLIRIQFKDKLLIRKVIKQ